MLCYFVTQSRFTVFTINLYFSGVVVDIEDNMLYRVRLYDGQQDVIPREEIYFLTQEKFSDAVSFIVRCEESLVGQAVVARNDFDGLFYLGKQIHGGVRVNTYLAH